MTADSRWLSPEKRADIRKKWLHRYGPHDYLEIERDINNLLDALDLADELVGKQAEDGESLRLAEKIIRHGNSGCDIGIRTLSGQRCLVTVPPGLGKPTLRELMLEERDAIRAASSLAKVRRVVAEIREEDEKSNVPEVL